MSDIAIIHGKVVPITGPDIDNGTVLISDGKIVAVGTDITIPDNTTIIDARGQWVLPGLVEAHGHIGIKKKPTVPLGMTLMR